MDELRPVAIAVLLLSLPAGLQAGAAARHSPAPCIGSRLDSAGAGAPDEQWRQAQPDSVAQSAQAATPSTAASDTLRQVSNKSAATDDAVSPKALIIIVAVTAVVLGVLVLTAFQ